MFLDPFILSQINTQAAQSNCVFPENSTPACVDGQQNCGFTCTDGFTACLDSNPPACVCTPPNVVCNGQCQAIGLCPSAQPQTSKKKRWLGSGACSEKGPGWAACGVYGGSPRAWECVNTARDLESCTFLSNPSLTLRVFVSVILTAPLWLVPPCCKKRWWLRYSAHALLPYRRGLLCASRRRRRRMSVWRMRRLPLSPRIQARARRP
jgi:hypothetical protein